MSIPEPFQLISQDQIDALGQRALLADRKRVNYNFHADMKDAVHRFLNVMARGTYVTPHRHWSTPKPESFVVLEGKVALILFDDGGAIEGIHVLGPETRPRLWGIDLEAGIWHSLVVLSDLAAIFEVKPGPYVAVADKDFAPWAPREGADGAEVYLGWMVAAAAQKMAGE